MSRAFTTTDPKHRTKVNLLRRHAEKNGLRLVKRRGEGLVLIDKNDPERAVLGGDRLSGATADEVARYLKLAV